MPQLVLTPLRKVGSQQGVTLSSLILVVDDNFAGQLLVCSVLEFEGFRVDSAGSSEEVIERLHARPPDLILMDVQLPGQDGLALTRQLTADPATAAIPIIALTANAMTGDREKAIAAGCKGYISKPIDTRTLGDQVREFLLPAHPEGRRVRGRTGREPSRTDSPNIIVDEGARAGPHAEK
jgi:two-component system, cell cycle response regulator DivK